MNHLDTSIKLEKNGQTVIFGPNGVGKSAIQEGLSFLQSDISISRFSNWSQPFKNFEKGFVEIGVFNKKNQNSTFRREYRKNRYLYFYNKKKVSASKFYQRLALFNISFNAANMISQGQVATKFEGKGRGSLREMIERITCDNYVVKKYWEIKDIKSDCERKIEDYSTDLGELSNKAYKLRSDVDILNKYDSIEKEMNSLRNKLNISDFLELSQQRENLRNEILDLKRKRKLLRKRKSNYKGAYKLCYKKLENLKAQEKELTDQNKKTTTQLRAFEILLAKKENENPLFKEYGDKLFNLEIKLKKAKRKYNYIESSLKNIENRNELIEDGGLISKIELLKERNEILEKEIEKEKKELEELKLTKFNEKKLEILEAESSKLQMDLNDYVKNQEELKQEYNSLKSHRISYPKIFKDFELFLKKHNVTIEGPACYQFKLKTGLPNGPKIRDLIIQISGMRLGAYWIKDKRTLDIARKYNKNVSPNKRVKIYYIKPETKVKKCEAPEGSLGFLADFIDVPPNMKPFVWNVLGRYLLVDDPKRAVDITYSFKIPTVTFDFEVNRPLFYGIENFILNKKKTLFTHHFGINDPEIINLKKKEIKEELDNFIQKIEGTLKKKNKINQERNKLIILKEKINNIQQFEQAINDKKEIVEKNNKTIIKLTEKISDIQKNKTFLERINKKKLKLSEKINNLESLINDLKTIEEYQEKIKSLNNKIDEEQLSELQKNIESFDVVYKSNLNLTERLNKKIEEIQTEIDEKLNNKKSTWNKIKIKILLIPINLNLNEYEIVDINFLENQIQILKRTQPSLSGVDLDARKKFLKISSRIKSLEKKFGKFRQKIKNLEINLKELSERWAKDFNEKIKRIEKDINHLISLLGISINLKLIPLDIEDAELLIKINTLNGPLDAKELSGGQKSLLNLAIFLGSNYFSANHFFLLDEMDQNLDIISTEMAKKLLNNFSKNHQVLILSPARDPQILTDAKLIFIDDRGKGVEIKDFSFNINNSEKIEA